MATLHFVKSAGKLDIRIKRNRYTGEGFTEEALSFLLTVIIAAVLARRCRRTACSPTTNRSLVDVLITLLAADYHDAKQPKTVGIVEFYCLCSYRVANL